MVDLPAPERPVYQRTQARCCLMAARAALVHLQRLPVDVLRAAQREVQHAGADRLAGQPIDDQEAARVVVRPIGIEGDVAIEVHVADADLVHRQRRPGQPPQRADVDLVLERRESCR